jgi:hypothetical protein
MNEGIITGLDIRCFVLIHMIQNSCPWQLYCWYQVYFLLCLFLNRQPWLARLADTTLSHSSETKGGGKRASSSWPERVIKAHLTPAPARSQTPSTSILIAGCSQDNGSCEYEASQWAELLLCGHDSALSKEKNLGKYSSEQTWGNELSRPASAENKGY